MATQAAVGFSGPAGRVAFHGLLRERGRLVAAWPRPWGAPAEPGAETPLSRSQTHEASTWRLPDAQTPPTPAPSSTAQIVPGLGDASGEHSHCLAGPEAVGCGFSCLLAILSWVLAGCTREWPPLGFGGLGTSELAS